MEDNHGHKKQRISSSSSSSSSRGHEINGNDQRKSKTRLSSTTMSSTQVGLRIVAQISSSSPPQDHQKHYSNNNVVLKSAVRLRQPAKKSSALDSCFLKTCNLCNKGLRLDKEVYMYRGDQGFCSKECRNRQIFLDEKKELEGSTKKMVAAYRNSCNSRNSETRSILEDLIHSRQTFMNKNNNNNNSQHRRNNRAVFIF